MVMGERRRGRRMASAGGDVACPAAAVGAAVRDRTVLLLRVARGAVDLTAVAVIRHRPTPMIVVVGADLVALGDVGEGVTALPAVAASRQGHGHARIVVIKSPAQRREGMHVKGAGAHPSPGLLHQQRKNETLVVVAEAPVRAHHVHVPMVVTKNARRRRAQAWQQQNHPLLHRKYPLISQWTADQPVQERHRHPCPHPPRMAIQAMMRMIKRSRRMVLLSIARRHVRVRVVGGGTKWAR
mmetsp:Transcript_8774/g.19659  ORF Transcript_8774/g.19659 Transcript_8774/m.19659 type:complete len:240 (+) Transcript_8774:493-1212(+)